jgi:23S rRNA (adenine2030-N6)-methyltransferase
MANRHYAEIGDIWKHLPLAEILANERPQQYWESHAGSAHYALTPAASRDYGAIYFLAHAATHPVLNTSAFWAVLDRLQPTAYPGSPFLALEASRARRFLFCDIDAESLSTIQEAARALRCGADVWCIQADGVDTLWQAAARLTEQSAPQVFAHIDPYRPWEINPAGRSALDLFGELTRRGVKSMLWYGYDSPDGRAVCWKHIQTTLAAHHVDPSRLWCGEINLAALTDPSSTFNPGVLGCGVLLGNLSHRTTQACARLGLALADIYRNAAFPDGRSGAIEFTIISLR